MRLTGCAFRAECAHTIINVWPKSRAGSAHAPAKHDFWQVFIALSDASSQYLCELHQIF